MKNIFKTLKYSGIFLLAIFSIIACDKDFNSIESSVLGDDNFNGNVIDYPIIAFNKPLDSLQVNNSNSKLLGIYNDPAYGQTIASIVAQLSPTQDNSANFEEDSQIDSVIVNIPYFSTQLGVDNNQIPIYKLDSLYNGNTNLSFKLSIYENKYLLRSLNPFENANTPQRYYAKNGVTNTVITTGENINFDADANKGEKIYENTNFTPKDNAIRIDTGSGENLNIEYLPPALRINLTKKIDSNENDENAIDYWSTVFLDETALPELNSVNNFRNYFRGLYFKAEPLGNDNGSLFLLNFAVQNSTLTVYHSSPSSETSKSFVLSLSTGNILNTFINNYDKVTIPSNPNKELGDDKLYLKGTSGSMAILKLFGDESEVDSFKRTFRKTNENGDFIKEANGNYVLKSLINEAQIIIYEDEIMKSFPKDENGNDHSKYDRLYVYDLKNNTPIVDYLTDPTPNTVTPINSRVLSLGRRITDEDGNSSKYKLRITEHLNNILVRDSSNVDLGLTILNNVNIVNTVDIFNNGENIKVPATSIITPRGTILHGSNTLNDNSKIKLKLFFTEPKK